MLNKIKTFIKKQRKKYYIKSIADYVNLNQNTRYGGTFNVDLRHPEPGKKYLSIGEHGIIDANIIFEKETGSVSIGDRCMIAGTIICIDGVEIGNDVIVAWDTLIYDHNSHSVYWNERKKDNRDEYLNYLKTGDPCANKDWSVVRSKPIHICDKAWIGTGCKILKGVTVGEGAVVQAGSVVTKNVEPWTIVGGNPAQLIRRLEPVYDEENS